MDSVKEVKKLHQAQFFTYLEYRKLKRKPPKVETKPETNPHVSRRDFFHFNEKVIMCCIQPALT
jgi:hypothetical protein